jgi:3alpha(or 20beta)-hydroxysteroid dehydrogenase
MVVMATILASPALASGADRPYAYKPGATLARMEALLFSKQATKQAFGRSAPARYREARMGRLDGKVALITGGARGMGKSHVRHFVAEGAKVVFGDVLDGQGQAVAAALGPGDCRYLHQDVTSEADWAAAVATATRTFGRLDILVNNAGVLAHGSISEMPLAEFRRIMDINALGCWLGMKSVIEPMKAAGGGSIVNISSIEGLTGAADSSAYAASKFAVRGMTKSAAQELGQFGIRVNSVHPGGILTRMVLETAGGIDAERGERYLKALPLGRFGKSAEISPLVAFLASDESSYCTGGEFVADGGILSGPGY